MEWGITYENPDDHLALVLDEPADFKPNEKYRYSNTNYLLLGKIMDRILGIVITYTFRMKYLNL